MFNFISKSLALVFALTGSPILHNVRASLKAKQQNVIHGNFEYAFVPFDLDRTDFFQIGGNSGYRLKVIRIMEGT